MIIKEVKINRSFLLLKEEVVIVTDEGNINLDKSFGKEVDLINKKLKDFKIESSEDFSKLKQALKNLNQDSYKKLELTLFNNIKNSWRFFNPAAVQIPRPIYTVLKKDSGIREFVVFSLNANNFDTVLSVGRRVKDFLNKKIDNVSKFSEEEIIMLIKEGIDIESENIDFELRIGVIFNNFNDQNYNSDKQFEFASKLIEKYSVAYVENIFSETDLDNYSKLNEKFKIRSLICLNSQIGEYTKGLNKKAFNSVVIKFEDISSFKTDVLFLKDHEVNIIAEPSADIMSMIVGLGIPLIKLADDNSSEQSIKKIKNIAQEIIKFKKQ